MIALDRVVQLRCKRGDHWESGSGYLLDDGLVLTAAHVVQEADPSVSIEARFLSSESWHKVSATWSDDKVDISLLRVEGAADRVLGRVPVLAEVKGTVVPVEAIGFPAFLVRERLRDTEHLLGELRLLSGMRAGLLEVDVVGQRVEADNWSGMSGSALFCKGRLVGVVVEALRDTGRLVALPLWKEECRALFRQAMGADISLETVVGMSGAQPSLLPKQLRGAPTSRLAYSARATRFVGRTGELKKMAAFLEDRRTFLWWLVTGGSGSGKSRLALELTLKHWGNWWSGFLATEQEEGFWSRWKPEWPTLMVVDYVGGRAAAVGKMVNALQERAQELEFPVRVLLIARSAEEPWLKEFLGRGSRTAREAILSARYEEPLQLQGLSPEDNWEIMEQQLASAGLLWSDREKQYLMQTRAGIDAGGSPLYSILLGEAFSRSDKGPWDTRSASWDANQLVEDVIERDRVQWEAAGMTREDGQALALATILGGLDLEVLEDERTQGFLPPPEDYSPERFKVITGKLGDMQVPPLHPSLVGESFVLSLPSSKIDRTLRKLVCLAFELNPVAAMEFAQHACMDFPAHPNVGQLLPGDPKSVLTADYPAETGGKEAKDLRFLSAALVLAYASRRMPAQAVEVAQTMLRWLEANPDDVELQETCAHTICNLIVHAAAQGEMVGAVRSSNTLGNLWSSTRAPAFAIALANAFFAIGTFAIGSGADAITRDAVDALHRLTSEARFPEVLVGRARLLVNVTVEACTNKEIESAVSRCAELMEIEVEGPLHSELVRLQAKALRNLCLAQAIGARLPEAEKAYKDLVRVVEGEPSLLRWRVVARADLIDGACDQSALEEAWNGYRDLISFADAAALDSEAKVSACGSFGTLALRLRKVSDCMRAEQIYFTWRDEMEGVPACRAIFAQVGANLVDAYVKAEDLPSACRIHADIRRLLAIEPSREEVGVDLGRATQVLLSDLAKKGMTAEATVLLTDFRRDLQALWANVGESLYMTGLFIVLIELTNPGCDPDKARYLARSHRAALQSSEFSDFVQAQFGAEFAEEWARRLDLLFSGDAEWGR